jgi:hypothetical protein
MIRLLWRFSSMKLSERIEVLANSATIVVALLITIVLARTYLFPPRPQLVPVGIQAGASMKSLVPGTDWAANGRTLLLGLSTQCHFCSESGPFFQRIAKQVRPEVKLVALLPQPEGEAREYLAKLAVTVDAVRQVSLNSVGITGTPTLVLVNKDGVVTHVWVGKLQSEQQDKVIDVLKEKPNMATNPSTKAAGL